MSACLKMGNFPLVDHHIANEKVLKAHTHTLSPCLPYIQGCIPWLPISTWPSVGVNLPLNWRRWTHFPIFEGNIYSFFPPTSKKRAFTCFKCNFLHSFPTIQFWKYPFVTAFQLSATRSQLAIPQTACVAGLFPLRRRLGPGHWSQLLKSESPVHMTNFWNLRKRRWYFSRVCTTKQTVLKCSPRLRSKKPFPPRYGLPVFKNYPRTCSNTCAGPVFWYFPDDEP